MRVVVVGASSGLGRCIGVGLARRGDKVALLARRRERLEGAVKEAGANALAIECDATDPASCSKAIGDVARAFDGLDAVIYAAGAGVLARVENTGVAEWQSLFATNVVGASLVTAAALPHLKASKGTAVYFSSVSASLTPPWPGLAAYAVTKAALDKLVEAWRAEHPQIGFTRLVVGECLGGEGDGMSGFASGFEPTLAAEVIPLWLARGYMTGALLPVDQLTDAVAFVLRSGGSAALPSLVVAPRPLS